jgi:Tol biopolymer transport system component/DNA-binding SARP family transcriptional activator
MAGALAQPRRLAVLAVLAAAGTRGVSRDRLLTLLWPDSDPERARHALAQALYALRRELGGDAAIQGITDLRLEPQMVQADLWEWEAALARNEDALAVSVYAGEFLDGFTLPGTDGFERWIEETRRDITRRHVATLERLAVAAAESGDMNAAANWWRRVAAIDPYSGRVALRLMQALAATGDHAGAIAHARVHTALLDQEFEALPDPDVTDLAERLRQAPAPRRAVERTDILAPVAIDAVVSDPGTQSDPTGAAESSAAPLAPIAPPRRQQSRTTRVALASVLALLAMLVWSRAQQRPATPSVPTPGLATRISADAVLELDPVISPDETLIAYVAGAASATRVYIRKLSGGPAVEVSGSEGLPHRMPTWSPDGAELYFQTRDGISRVSALGGAPRRVLEIDATTGRPVTPAVSPDGRLLAFGRGAELRVRGITGGAERVVATLAEVHSPAWSPDGKTLAFVDGNLAYLIGGGPSLGTLNLGNTGQSVIYTVAYDPESTEAPVRLTPTNQRALSPSWSPEGRQLLYLSDHEGSRDVYARPWPVGTARRLTVGLHAHTARLAPSGTRLSYATFTLENNVWAIDIPVHGEASIRDAVPITRGTQTVEGLAVSPDGAWLAYDSDLGGSQDIWRLPLGGGAPERLSDLPGDDFLPAWSPDGRELAFYAYVGDRRQLRTMPSEGGRPSPVVDDRTDDRYPSWSSDGASLLFARYVEGHYRLFRIDRHGDGWGPARGAGLGVGESARWSPKGGTALFLRHDPLRLSLGIPGDSTSVRDLLQASGSRDDPYPALAEWDPSGTRIYYKALDRDGNASIWAINVDGSGKRPIVRFDDPERPTSRSELATDGRRVYFTVGQPRADVWVMALTGGW